VSLEKFGIIQPTVIKDKPGVIQWNLTEKGKDTVPSFRALWLFGAKWIAGDVFEDS
jgi:DNA-binding HxlR family transcriptional regulator